MATSVSGAAALEEQQEKLRRFVDAWSGRADDLMGNLEGVEIGLSPEFGDSSSSSDAVRVVAELLEQEGIPDIVDSDNVAVSKFVTVLAYDCSEISRLSRHASRHLYRQLLLFGYRSSSREMLLEGEPQKAFGHSLALFMELCEVTHQMKAVLLNLLQQLDSVYSCENKNSRPINSFTSILFNSVFSSFTDGLSMFLIMDEIFRRNEHIKNYLSLFGRMLNMVQMENHSFDISLEDLDCLNHVFSHLEKVLEIGLFQRLLEETSWQGPLQKVRCNKSFFDACTFFCRDGFLEILSHIDTVKEFPYDRRRILTYVSLVLFVANASGEFPGKGLEKVILEILEVVPVIYIEGGIRFMLLDIFQTRCPQLISSLPNLRNACSSLDITNGNYLKRLDEMHLQLWESMREALSCWLVSFQAAIHPLRELSKVEACLRLHLEQIIRGICLANRMQTLTISLLDLHALLEVPIKREKLKSLCHMVVLLKVIKSTFLKKVLDIIESLPHMINIVQTDIEQLLVPVRNELQRRLIEGSPTGKLSFLSSFARGAKDTDMKLADTLELVKLSLEMLQGGGSNKRLWILSVALDALESIGHPNIKCLRIRRLLRKINILANFQSVFEEATMCGFLFWWKEIIGTCLSMIYMDVNKFSWLQNLLDAFCDGLWLLKLGNVGKTTLEVHEREIDNAVKKEIIDPLCRDIETDLRLHVHSSHLKGSVHVNPKKTGVRNLSWYLHMKPLKLPFKFIDVKLYVERYLNSTFYIHTVMCPYNWKIYSEMRILAELKYGLVLDDIHLPERSPSHGLDISEIMQNLQKFVVNYSFNLYQKIFIEKVTSDQVRKTQKAFGVEHASFFLDAHGLGTLTVTMRHMSEFLRKKLSALSVLQQDNYVSSHLVKEIRLWKSEKEVLEKYILVQMEEHAIPKLKQPFEDHELSFLELLGCAVTEIGNTIGLVWILQAGCSHHVNNISGFIHKGTKSFTEYSKILGLSDATVAAGSILDIAAGDNYVPEDHSSHVSSLVTLCAEEIKNSDDIHLKDFFLLLPAVIINLVNSKAQSKEKIRNRGRDAGNHLTTNDGFMLGAAFVLRITGQLELFDGLKWFAAAHKHLEEALSSLEGRILREQQKQGGIAAFRLWGQSAPSISAEHQKEMDRIKRYQQELELIQYGYNVARAIIMF